jgi:DNA-binding LacI/PurR family transcriptional regulator
MAAMGKGPGLKTVARAVGVSVATVSNAYNKPDHLSTALRERIFAAAQELRYAGPDPAARSLRGARSGSIGVLSTVQLSYAFTDPYCTEYLAGVADIAERYQTSVLLMPLAPRAVSSDEEVRQSVAAVRNAVIDGVVIDGIDDGHPALRVVDERRLPRVRSTDDPAGRCVMIDDRAAGESLGRHLADLGHRNVAVVAASVHAAGQVCVGADDSVLYPYARLRVAGLRDGLGAGARLTVVAVGPNRPEDGRAAAAEILRWRPRASAIVGTSDVLGLSVLAALREHGVHPGAEVSVSGFDDIPDAAVAGLTTVRQPIREKGRLMARMLLDPAMTQRRIVLPARLVIRTSTAPAQAAIPATLTSDNEKEW